MLNESHVSTVVYFWQEYRDLERATVWPETKAYFERESPHIVKAYNDYKIAKDNMDAVVRDLAARYNSQEN